MRLDAVIGPDARLTGAQAAVEIAGLTADSRAVKPGYLFAALKGVKSDGSAFVASALSQGAVAILTDEATSITVDPRIPVLRNPIPRAALARAAARFYHAQPGTVVAVTGTNGKTSVAAFIRQLWAHAGLSAASVGTVGIVSPKGERKLHHTTPDPVELQAVMAELAAEAVTHAAIEASSHGLAQYRLDGLAIAAGAFTNISRDHLDYHKDFEEYFQAKARLFAEVLPPSAPAVINADCAEAHRVIAIAKARGLKLITVGHEGSTVRLVGQERLAHGQRLQLAIGPEQFDVDLPLVGDFQASNALVALGLAMACGMDPAKGVQALSLLRGASGRLELVATWNEAPIFVDFAHTPDALENAITALRPYAKGRLIVVFGAGGDRDPGKRPQMGTAVARFADVAVVTDDNPRSEDPAAIRAQVLAGCPDGIDGGDRPSAIRAAIAMLAPGDILMVAGKGHETGQEIGGRIIPFSDQSEIRAAVREAADD
ncbi:UDP-N-acetylmuramoyl-L-alanyl-D-glutamate--2,6-diaminopimelate ligase [Rhodoligotrophos appendicifer]|uniref:UDP-N-acetylmuramoyl-L-alanyl-D-glutamate--2, 6-diaminopimelate ligase n=1 Tax=Rhodoligotrophos appendicifer TaxID=987056 RepID=UPI0011870CF6|nr:UDP-N-acetylmuramoyl-L-alanyl-D-glutamate--2,6-diaminopimelate ligase [Rhodoligotrophos appendicifer]